MNFKDKLSSLREEIIQSIKDNLDEKEYNHLEYHIKMGEIFGLAKWADDLIRESYIRYYIQRQEEESHYKEDIK